MRGMVVGEGGRFVRGSTVPLMTKTGCGAAESETDRWTEREREEGGTMHDFMKKGG